MLSTESRQWTNTKVAAVLSCEMYPSHDSLTLFYMPGMHCVLFTDLLLALWRCLRLESGQEVLCRVDNVWTTATVRSVKPLEGYCTHIVNKSDVASIAKVANQILSNAVQVELIPNCNRSVSYILCIWFIDFLVIFWMGCYYTQRQ